MIIPNLCSRDRSNYGRLLSPPADISLVEMWFSLGFLAMKAYKL
jgi:hypothetical protein